MFIPSISGAAASTVSGALPNTDPAAIPPIPRDQVRHLLFGTLSAVQNTIRLLHKLGYAEPNDWSRPMSTGRPNEVMAILTRRVGVE
ncbi:MAG: hypothetical protein WA783_18615 [Phormidesmis sp.]